MPEAKKTNWANRGKAALKAVNPNAKGQRVAARVESVTYKTYKTGSEGVEFRYTRDDNKRTMYNNIVLFKDYGSGMTETKTGMQYFGYALKSAGLTDDEIASFPDPSSSEGAEALASLIGSKVTLILTEEIGQDGSPREKVKAVFAA